jgi:poly(hydroxyalkanoate) depolymerase family esterase
MTPHFERMMAEAARLMRSGQLHEATAAIQAALGATPASPRAAVPPGWKSEDDGEVIDVEARAIDDPSPPPAAQATSTPSTAQAGTTAAPAGTADIPPTGADSFSSGTFHNELGTRGYKLFEPARDGRALPLVVMLHGCTQDPDDFARGTGMNALAREHGFLVLYPEQTQRANTSRCWNWFKHNHQARGKGEPGILAGMVRDVIARHGVDADRVYVAGLSAGGAMAAILGDAYPDLFAAVGVHSGLATGSATDVQSAFAAMNGGANPVRRSPKTGATPPTIVFHGDADTTVHVVNGERVIEAAGGEAKPGARRESAGQGLDFTKRVYLDDQGAERAEQWTIHCAGHAWSGGQSTGSYTEPRGPDASAEMIRFFFAHPKR